MARLNHQMASSAPAKDVTPKKLKTAWFWKSPKEVVESHQKNAGKGKYGGNAKTINKAREEKNKIINDFLNN